MPGWGVPNDYLVAESVARCGSRPGTLNNSAAREDQTNYTFLRGEVEIFNRNTFLIHPSLNLTHRKQPRSGNL